MQTIIQLLRRYRQFSSWKTIDTTQVHRTCSIDRLSRLGKYVVLFQRVALGKSSVGDYTYIADGTICTNTEIGKYCSIAANVVIGLQDHPMGYISTSPIFYDCSQPLPMFFTENRNSEPVKRTNIGNDVWIGNGVRIKAGLTIGSGSVIGAGSIVTKDIEPYTVVAGVPAKVIKRRFSTAISARLLDSKWWDLDSVILSSLSKYFSEPIMFLEELERSRL